MTSKPGPILAEEQGARIVNLETAIVGNGAPGGQAKKVVKRERTEFLEGKRDVLIYIDFLSACHTTESRGKMCSDIKMKLACDRVTRLDPNARNYFGGEGKKQSYVSMSPSELHWFTPPSTTKRLPLIGADSREFDDDDDGDVIY